MFLGAAIGLLAFGCSGNAGRDYAAEAAKAYYDSLMAGGYAYFVDGFLTGDSIPPSYREQLIVNAKQYVSQTKEAHHGVNDIRVVCSKVDSVAKTTNVFLMLCFGDSVNEEVVVPMVAKDGVWYMK